MDAATGHGLEERKAPLLLDSRHPGAWPEPGSYSYDSNGRTSSTILIADALKQRIEDAETITGALLSSTSKFWATSPWPEF
jgi:hypothetical protein